MKKLVLKTLSWLLVVMMLLSISTVGALAETKRAVIAPFLRLVTTDSEQSEVEVIHKTDIVPEDETVPEGETKPEGETVPEGETKPEGETVPEGETKPEGESVPEGETKPEGESVPEDETVPEGVSVPEGEAVPEGETKPEGEAVPEGETKPEGETAPEDETQVEAAAGIAIRAAADHESELLLTVSTDAEMEILDREGDWLQVKAGDVTGYVYKPVIVEAPVPEPVQEVQEEQPVEAEPATLNIHAAADRESEVLLAVPVETEMEVLGREGDWLQVKVGDVTGYAYQPVAEETPAPETPAQEEQPEEEKPATMDIHAAASLDSELLLTVPADTEMETLGREGDWLQVKVGDVTGYTFSPAVAEEPEQPEEAKPVTTDIHAAASLDSEVLLTVPAETEMEILSREGDWLQVKVGDVTGYVFSPAEPEATGAETTFASYLALVTTASQTGTVNVYAAASADASVIAQLLSGSAVTVTGVEGEFAQISVNALTGYISLGAVAPVEDDAEIAAGARAAYIVMDIPQNVRLGDTITLSCVLEGYDGLDYQLQWESAATDWDGNVTGDWQAVSGANGQTLSVELTESSIFTAWRLQIDVPAAGEQQQ